MVDRLRLICASDCYLAWYLRGSKDVSFGEKTFFVVDMNQMYSDMLAYLKSFFSEQNNLLYTFSKNLGGDMLTPYAFYFGNPLNFIVCLFPAADLPKVVSF
jgi:uncharacterized membrane protein YfhO